MHRWTIAFAGLLSFGATATTAKPAAACGGTFCDQTPVGQPPMPVDQTGENVIFVMGLGWVEAHIQIQYQGAPERFAWVIPLPAKPDLSVGSQTLFTNVLNATVPTFNLTTTFQSCSSGGSSTSSGAGCGFGASSASSGGSYAPTGSNNTDSNAPKVVSRSAVGNFETVTLEPTSAQGMLDWLTQNGYEPDGADAAPVIQDYVDRGYVFVAVKLQANKGVDEIHPLVVRYSGTEPCVPLKLTRIAAVEDMTVRVFFLGDRRVVPTGAFKHVELNPARLDWANFGQNYALAIARAVDAPVADGRAFVTEFAGPSAIVSTQGLYAASWTGAPFEQLPPQQVVDQLESLGLMSCPSQSNCVATHPLVFPLLETYLPAPTGVSEPAFYSCIECYPGADLSAWDGLAFAADFEELIAKPGQRAQGILQANFYLTRMVTRISPSEMTEDPMFREGSLGLPVVSNQRLATRTTRCDGSIVTQGSDGRRIEGTSAPADFPSDMPWAERVEEFAADGARIVLVDNADEIDATLAGYNSSETSGLGSAGSGSDSGCACSLHRHGSPQGLAFALLTTLGLLRRAARRRRRQ